MKLEVVKEKKNGSEHYVFLPGILPSSRGGIKIY
jgi:hypothetical protein